MSLGRFYPVTRCYVRVAINLIPFPPLSRALLGQSYLSSFSSLLPSRRPSFWPVFSLNL